MTPPLAAVQRAAFESRLDPVEPPAKLDAAAGQFEAMLLRQILHQALKPTFQAAASDRYQDMIEAHLADALSQGGGIGLAQFLRSELAQPRDPSSPASCTIPSHSHD